MKANLLFYGDLPSTDSSAQDVVEHVAHGVARSQSSDINGLWILLMEPLDNLHALDERVRIAQ